LNQIENVDAHLEKLHLGRRSLVAALAVMPTPQRPAQATFACLRPASKASASKGFLRTQTAPLATASA
jgi:hypothetical protein